MIALKVFQQAIYILAKWADARLDPTFSPPGSCDKISKAKELLGGWPSNEAQPQPLKLVFDRIQLASGPTASHYWPLHAIANTNPPIPYPVSNKVEALQNLDVWKQDVRKSLEQITSEQDWNNLALLTLILEKCGSYTSFGKPDVSLFDLVKTTAAVAAANPLADNLCLIAGDLSGIQNFIYTIASDGALKSLRARSFYVALVAEEIVQQLLTKLELPRTSVIYAGGGNLYLLAPADDTTHAVVEDVWQQANSWLIDTFQTKLFLGLDYRDFPAQDVGTPEFANHWESTLKQLAKQKNRKFEHQLSAVLSTKDAHDPCKVCHRDDEEPLQPLDGEDGVPACSICREMFHLGNKLFDVDAIVRSRTQVIDGAVDSITITLDTTVPIHYHFFRGTKPIQSDPETAYLINNWDVNLYRSRFFENPTPLLIGNYAAASRENHQAFIRAEELAEVSHGIKRVGYLRMDVDRLGQIFAKGLNDAYTLPRLTTLSRQISYFFTAYLTSTAKIFQPTLHNHKRQHNHESQTQQNHEPNAPNLLFIYAGGDDLFISGAWNEIVEFAFDVYQSFRAYTGNHPDITLSGGISLEGPKYPLYQAAADAGNAENAAKDNGRDSLSVFGETFKWGAWLGAESTRVLDLMQNNIISQDIQTYINEDITLDLFGVLPFVKRLDEQLDTNYSRNFVQNLLATAQLQERLLAAIQEKEHARDVRYYLHLPKIAYTLARARAAPDISKSLKSPYNAPYFRAIATWISLLNRT